MEENNLNRVRDIPFNEKEVSTISSCSHWMRFIGYVSNIVAFLFWLVGIVFMLYGLSPKGNKEMVITGIISIAVAFFPFFMSLWVIRSARSFMDVLNTTIDDQGFLSEGFRSLQKYFLTLGVIIIVIIAIIVLGIIFWSTSSFKPAQLF